MLVRNIIFLLQGNKLENQLSPEERQIVRKRRLKEYCRNHTFDKNPTPENLHMLAVDDKQKFIYCVVSKVATTTWKSLLAPPRGDRAGINRWRMWRRLTNFSEKERTQRLNTYFKFLFVREPIHRMLSAYKNKFLKIPSYTTDLRKQIVQELRPESYKPEGRHFVSFPEFMQYFADNKTRNQHWRQYEKICHPCVIDYDFIGHFETLGEDGPLLLKLLGLDDQVKFPPIHKSTGESALLKYYSQVPTRYITKIGELYRSDYEMFGYDFLGPVKELLKRDDTQPANRDRKSVV